MKQLFESIDKTGEFSKSPAHSDYLALIKELDDIKGEISPKESSDELPESFYKDAELLIRYGNFKKLGSGSSRIAYSFNADPRYVLKFAYNDNGLKQNRTEIKNAMIGSGDYTCTVRILAYDDDNILIVEDNCRQSTYDDWKRILGIVPSTLAKIVHIVLSYREKRRDSSYTIRDFYETAKDPVKAADLLSNSKDPAWIPFNRDYHFTDQPKMLEFLKNLIMASDSKPVAEKYRNIFDVFRFYFDNGEGSMIPGEIMYQEQWGVRLGKTPAEDSLVIIDPGMDIDYSA